MPSRVNGRRPQLVWLWLIVISLSIALQYISVTTMGVLERTTWHFAVPTYALNEAGPERYAKDLLSVLFALGWPLTIRLNRDIVIYYIWLLALLAFGCFAYLAGIGYLPFLPAGLRWVINIHNAFGVYCLTARSFPTLRLRNALFLTLLALVSLSAIYSGFEQLAAGSRNLRTFRATGIFSQAGISASFGVASLFLSEFVLRTRKLWQRTSMAGASLTLAVLAGTRFAVVCILIFLYSAAIDYLFNKGVLKSVGAKVFVHLLMVPALGLVAIGLSGTLTGRGDIVEDQLNDRGRIGNGFEVVETLSDRAQPLNLLIGMGLGQGTNTAASMEWPLNSQTKWQLLVDNTFITTFIQFGLLGTMLFFGGVFLFMATRGIRYHIAVILFVLLALVTQNLPEQTIMVLALGAYIGLQRNIVATRRRQRREIETDNVVAIDAAAHRERGYRPDISAKPLSHGF